MKWSSARRSVEARFTVVEWEVDITVFWLAHLPERDRDGLVTLRAGKDGIDAQFVPTPVNVLDTEVGSSQVLPVDLVLVGHGITIFCREPLQRSVGRRSSETVYLTSA